MRYLVYGAGAVGGVVGAHLHLAGLPTTLLARGEHLARLQRDGLLLDREDGEHRLPIPAVGGAAEVDWREPVTVLLCVKGHQTGSALADLSRHAPLETVVVTAQNGTANEEAALRVFPRAQSVCVMLPATHLEPGVVVQKCFPTPGLLDVGPVAGPVTDTTELVAADLRRAGFESVPRADVMAWKRRKLLMNLANGVDACCPPGEDADELVERCRSEAEALFTALGLPVVTAEQDAERRGDRLRRRTDRDLVPGGSTWQSMRRGVDSEIDHLAGEVVLLGLLHDRATPANALVREVTRELSRTGGEPRSVDAAVLLRRLDD